MKDRGKGAALRRVGVELATNIDRNKDTPEILAELNIQELRVFGTTPECQDTVPSQLCLHSIRMLRQQLGRGEWNHHFSPFSKHQALSYSGVEPL